MLQASLAKPPSALVTGAPRPINDGHDSDSDDDKVGSLPSAAPTSPAHGGGVGSLSNSGSKKLSTSTGGAGSFSAPTLRWECEKANKYGLKETRILVLDTAAHAIRFYERTSSEDQLKTEIPLNQIASTQRKNPKDDPRRVEMQFKEDRRAYELFFKAEEEAIEFQRLASAEISEGTATTTRSYSASVHRGGGHNANSSLSQISPSSTNHHSASLSFSSNSASSGHGREASESIAIQSELGGPSMPRPPILPILPGSAPQHEDHNSYLDYQVSKKNRFSIKQNRILVINAVQSTMLLLDEKRKFKKEFALSSILSVEIPKTKSDSTEAQAYIVFQKELGQKPFHLFFADTLDRLHFCERLVSLAPHELSIKDESDHIEDDHSLRFGILKINKVGVKKKRIVVLRSKEQVLRSFNREKSYKDVSFANIVKWEKPIDDRCRLNLYLKNRPHPLILIFPDTIARERFNAQCNFISRSMEEAAWLVENHNNPSASAPSSSSAANSNSSSSSSAPSSSSSSSDASAPYHSDLTIFCGTWNLGNSPFTYESLGEFIPPMKYDLYVIGLQECSKGDREQWLQEIRNHIQQSWKGTNPAGTNNNTSSSDGNNSSKDNAAANHDNHAPTSASSSSSSSSSSASKDAASKDAAYDSDKDDTPSSSSDDQNNQPYALLGVVKLWEIVLMVLIRRPLLCRVSNLFMDTIATGVGDVLGNKGGCGISFTFQDVNLCFVACHLAARSERVQQRAENYMKILKQLQLGAANVDILAQNDHVFWLGDLNCK